MSLRRFGCLCAAAAFPLARSVGQQLSPTDRAQAVATLWAEARYNFAYWDRVRADWDSGLVANLHLAAQPQPDLLFYRRLRRYAALLADGQAAVTPPPSLQSRIARPPLLLRSVERRPFILDYVENDEMRVARPPRLAEILSVQGLPAAVWIRDSVLPEISAATEGNRWQRAVEGMLEGARGTPLQLVLRVPGGETRGLSVTRSVPANRRWPFEPAPLELDTLPDGFVWVRLNTFAAEDVVQRFDRAFQDFDGVRGLIIDLRENSGEGPVAGAYHILARLTDRPFLTTRWSASQYRPVFHAWGEPDSARSWYGAAADSVWPRRDRPGYAGPVAVLSSPRTRAAAEEFLVAFRTAGRGPIIGETSGGSTGDTMELPLPKGGAVRLCVQRKAFPDGTEFVGLGIAPDLPVEAKVNDLLAGRDAALDLAREYLSQDRRASQPPN